jgi:hypothetical protein
LAQVLELEEGRAESLEQMDSLERVELPERVESLEQSSTLLVGAEIRNGFVDCRKKIEKPIATHKYTVFLTNFHDLIRHCNQPIHSHCTVGIRQSPIRV